MGKIIDAIKSFGDAWRNLKAHAMYKYNEGAKEAERLKAKQHAIKEKIKKKVKK